MSSRNQYNGRFKAQVALEAIKNQRTIGEIAHEYGIHPSQIHKWKKHIKDKGAARPREASVRTISEGRTGLVEKKSWFAQLTRNVTWWN
jgi:putative transposase